MNICLVSSEVAPFSKTGGLADVVGALAPRLAARGHRVLTVSPRYRQVDPERHALRHTGQSVRVTAGRWGEVLGIRHTRLDGVHHVLVEHPTFTDRDGIYGDSRGTFGDNHVRYALLSRSAIEIARRLSLDGEPPLGEQVVFHANDWQTALVPVYLQALHREVGLFEQAATVLTIHNLAHQGRFDPALFPDLELAPRWFEPWSLEWFGDLALLKGGVLQADQITTVSPTFAWEMTTPQGGFGLDGVLGSRSHDLTGILNGIDTDAWDPATDPHLHAHYSARDLRGKAVCKAALQTELGLPVQHDAPLVGSIGRLDPQKGVEMLLESIPWLVEQGAQVVVLGSAAEAHAHYEAWLRALEARYPHHVRSWVGFSEPVAHRIEAGADLFVMPSLFEPCGLNQLYSMRYGTPPVVRHTGGLADSVEDCDPASDSGTGFVFHTPSGHDLRDALWRALHLYRSDPAGWTRLVRRAMARDVSWDTAIPRYEEVYRRALQRRGVDVPAG